MNYITDYQLDINRGFMCKVNGKTFTCEFKYSDSSLRWFISNILRVADAMGIPRQNFIDIFNSDYINHVIYCDSKQQCHDLCKIIIKLYFRPKQTEHERLVPDLNFIYNDKLYQFTLKILNTKYVWQNVNDICTHIFIKTHPDLPKIKKELNINISTSQHSEYLGFDTKEDAIKFAKYVTEYYYSKTDKKEFCEKIKKNLVKYCANDETYIIKKEKTYDTNQLRKERAIINRGVKPAGSIIHGRRGKASIRRGCIKHQTCFGY